MDLASALFGPGLIGGLLIALWLFIAHRRSRTCDGAVPRRDAAALVDPINMSRIHVAGVGGLGLVAMAVIVAVFVPFIGVSLAIAAASGLILAVGLVLWRRRRGPLPSSGQTPGAATMFALESPASPAGAVPPDPESDGTRTTPRLRMA